MRIVHQDTKKGFIELVPETLDDLWHLSHIIIPGDLISSKTTRRVQDNTGERLRSDRGIKKTFFMGIRVENISFHKYTGKLRATGIIEKGSEDIVPLGTHHTIELKLKNPVKITKEKWTRWAIKRLKTAVDSSKKPSAIIVAIEDDVTVLGIIKQYGIDYYGPIVGGIPGKRIVQKDRSKNITNFYNEIAKTLQGFEGIQGIVIAGPGFAKGDFYNFLNDKYPQLAKIAGVENTGTGGRVGIQEVLRKGTIEQMATEGRIAQEIRLVNKVLEEIGKSSNLITYGKSDVENAANAGAIQNLLVIDNLVRDEEIENLMNLVESTGGNVMVVSSEHDGGKQLQALGGIAGLLRYSLG